jgi:hypothetical protein
MAPDRALLRRALQEVNRLLAPRQLRSDEERARLERALDVIAADEVGQQTIRLQIEILRRLLNAAPGLPDRLASRFVTHTLKWVLPPASFGAPLDLVVRLWEIDWVRAQAAAEVSYGNWVPDYWRLVSVARTLERRRTADQVFEAYLAKVMQAGYFDLFWWHPSPEIVGLAIRAALDRTAPRTWVEVYRRLPDWASAARFLERITTLQRFPRDEFISAITQAQWDRNNVEDLLRELWIRDFVGLTR